ncbi:MAG: NUDIX hydrolase N-terminal domain-containing protein [Actinomycetota bacterium]
MSRDRTGLLEEIQALARTGLHYADDPFDRERYERLLAIALDGLVETTGVPEGELRERFAREVGCITPKVGADGVVFDDDDRVLLERRTDDGRWGLISGWVEPDEHPAETVVREAEEELGLSLVVDRLAAVRARPATADNGPHSLVAVIFLCSIVGEAEIVPNHEVLEARWWAVDDVTEWHMSHEHYTRAALAVRHGQTPPLS